MLSCVSVTPLAHYILMSGRLVKKTNLWAFWHKALKWLEEMLTDVETETGFAYSEGQCMSNNKVFSNY